MKLLGMNNEKGTVVLRAHEVSFSPLFTPLSLLSFWRWALCLCVSVLVQQGALRVVNLVEHELSWDGGLSSVYLCGPTLKR